MTVSEFQGGSTKLANLRLEFKVSLALSISRPGFWASWRKSKYDSNSWTEMRVDRKFRLMVMNLVVPVRVFGLQGPLLKTLNATPMTKYRMMSRSLDRRL